MPSTVLHRTLTLPQISGAPSGTFGVHVAAHTATRSAGSRREEARFQRLLREHVSVHFCTLYLDLYPVLCERPAGSRCLEGTMFIDRDTVKTALKLTFGRKYFHPRRFAFQAAIAPIFSALWVTDYVGRKLDDRFFPEYESADVGQPIFIMASPRSGTTFLHRLMSLDEQFTSYTLWQTMLPTLVAYEAMDGLKRLDSKTGNLLDKTQDAIARYVFRGWEGIHKTRFDEAEEDEAIFTLQLSTPSVMLSWPFVEELSRVAYVDQLPTREKLSEFFLGTMKRHMWH